MRLEREDGAVGWGEVAPLPWFGTETVVEAEEACRALGDRPDESALAAVPERLSCVRFALAAARAEVAGAVPLVSTKRLAVAALLPAGRAALDVLGARLESGFLSFKWKVGVGRPEEEWGVLDDLLASLPTSAKLRLDANGAWSRRDAGRWLERCAERPVEFVEQPVAPEAVDDLLKLATDFPVKLALDESVATLASARAWHERGWGGVFVLKPALAGPLEVLLDWVRVAQVDVVFSSAMESVLARRQIVRAVLAAGVTRRALGFGVGPVFGARELDGPEIGPLMDGDWAASFNPEAQWTACN